MKFDIREYVSFSSQDYVSFVSGGWARAWFPEGVKFDETKVSTGIFALLLLHMDHNHFALLCLEKS